MLIRCLKVFGGIGLNVGTFSYSGWIRFGWHIARFDFWECVHWNLETRVAPLRAYRKTIQFRLLFYFIRSPETPQKLIQPQPLHLFQPGVRLDFWAVFEPFSGTNRSGSIGNPPERIQKSLDVRQVSFCTLLDLLFAALYGILLPFLKPKNHTFSLYFFFPKWFSP